MAEPFTYKAWPTRFHCGDENPHVQLINLFGPDNAKATAYSCSMNVDVDGEPQCYGPPNMDPIPRDSLQDAGYLDPGTNAAIRKAYEDVPAATQRLKDLTSQRNDLTNQRHAKDPAPDHATKVALDKKILELDKEIKKEKMVLGRQHKYFDKKPPWSRRNNPEPVNRGKVFWDWYGVFAMTPQEAHDAVFDEGVPGIPKRHPLLDDKKPELCDVFGRYPVIQSKFEPGPGYYVSAISVGSNARPATGPSKLFEPWDQRYYLPEGVVSSNDPVMPPYAALSSGLTSVSGVVKRNQVLAINRDTGTSLAFPFMDGAYGNKVAECSLSAFLKLGGKEVFLRDKHKHKTKEIDRRHWDNSKFELLYIAFPNSQSPHEALGKFASATNASDFPILMAFLAGTRGPDALLLFKRWQESKVPNKPQPAYFSVIEPALRAAGFKP